MNHQDFLGKVHNGKIPQNHWWTSIQTIKTCTNKIYGKVFSVPKCHVIKSHKDVETNSIQLTFKTVYYDRTLSKMVWQHYPWYPLHMSLDVQQPSAKQNEAGPCQEMKSGHPAMSRSTWWLSYCGSYCIQTL